MHRIYPHSVQFLNASWRVAWHPQLSLFLSFSFLLLLLCLLPVLLEDDDFLVVGLCVMVRDVAERVLTRLEALEGGFDCFGPVFCLFEWHIPYARKERRGGVLTPALFGFYRGIEVSRIDFHRLLFAFVRLVLLWSFFLVLGRALFWGGFCGIRMRFFSSTAGN